MSGFDINDLNWKKRKYTPWGAYAQSKLANILLVKHLAAMLEGTPIKIFTLHPGIIATNLFKNVNVFLVLIMFSLGWLFLPLASKTVPQGAATQVYAATVPQL
ncbi:hypothetical protein CEUSTIGMA_g8433.t1 [Chlamydomonas eustigma]|uniref:Uncharacterized protein n=1 Tax=Chlamydomonas eustigma TaxID=1157962 RepID=A0A250XD36_9CHLO|nr:hypothetical protein CEUSTIGMA_g8433.t1 [Chlamydomonas eustigma]|eukprot:GAX80998.1 hypothetical protein CEUSTIGMA_g8433.t1 [Chlamydomonas eustigma]